MVPLWMLANALACGNAFVLKPSEKDPSAALRLAELASEAGLPDGVLNVVQGDAEAVDRLLTHPDVAAVSFVGSTPVARHVYETAHRRTASAPRPWAAPRTTWSSCPTPTSTPPPTPPCPPASARRGSGAWPSRWWSPSGRPPIRWSRRSRARIPDVVVGAGDDPASMMGPLITAAHRDRVRSYIAGAGDEGARVVVDGSTPPHAEGFFLGCSLHRRRQAGHARLRRRDLRARARRGPGGHAGRGHRPRQRRALRQRRRPVHR